MWLQPTPDSCVKASLHSACGLVEGRGHGRHGRGYAVGRCIHGGAGGIGHCARGSVDGAGGVVHCRGHAVADCRGTVAVSLLLCCSRCCLSECTGSAVDVQLSATALALAALGLQGRTVVANAAEQVSLHRWLVGQQQQGREDRTGRCSAAQRLPHSCPLSLVACADLRASLRLLRRSVWLVYTPETQSHASNWQQLYSRFKYRAQVPVSASITVLIAGFLALEPGGPSTQGHHCQVAASCSAHQAASLRSAPAHGLGSRRCGCERDLLPGQRCMLSEI